MSINIDMCIKNAATSIDESIGEHPLEEVKVRSLLSIANSLLAIAAWNTRHVETCRLNELDALTQTLSMVNGCAWNECSKCGCLTPDDSTYCINCGRKVEDG